MSTTVYHKDASEPYVVPFTSDHPMHIFRNIIYDALIRAIRYSFSLKAFDDESREIRLKLLYNGYVDSLLPYSHLVMESHAYV